MVLFYTVIKVREEYLEDVIYHQIKTEEIARSTTLIKTQREELLDLQKRIYEIKTNDNVCSKDPSKQCTHCDDKCPFREEGDL
jgi:hypothetical protein